MWKTIGQTKVLDILQRALEKGTLSHAYLLTGPPQTGKMTLALELAMALNCQTEKGLPCGECNSCQKIASGRHADVQTVSLNQNLEAEESKERTEIGIEQIKEMLRSASLPPFEGKYKIYIIEEAGKLSMEAANRLLKTLEEPPEKVVFILLTTNIRLIPATVISRCQRINTERVKTEVIAKLLRERWGVEPEQARLLSRLSHGCPGWAIEISGKPNWLQERNEQFEKMTAVIKGSYAERFTAAAQMAQQFGKKRESVYETLDTWTGWWRDILLAKTGSDDYIVSIDYQPALDEMAGAFSLAQIKSAIEIVREAGEQLKLNANARLVLEVMMLNLPRPELVNSQR